MRKWILNIHLYGLLLCSSYLILFGASSVVYNHRQFFAQSDTTTVHWQKNITVDTTLADSVLVPAIRDLLGLIGWYEPGRTYWDSSGVFNTALARPAKHYTIRYFPTEHLVTVEEECRGFWEIIGSLHGFSGLSGSDFLSIWWWYTELCTLFVIFGAISGVYLWATSKKERKVGYSIVIVSSITSIILMLYLWIIG